MIEPDAANGCVRITYVLPSTPAERAGLQSATSSRPSMGADKGLGVEAVSGRLRGKPGTVVAVAVARAAPGRLYDRARGRAAANGRVQDAAGRHRLRLGMEFGRATPYEFDTAVARLNELGAKALVLDLRNDGGGYVNSALDISSRFIANKALVTVEERGKDATTIEAAAIPRSRCRSRCS